MSQRINLNTTPNQFMPILYFSQGDIGRTFEIALTSSDGYSIPIGATVEMVATKPSGFGFTVSGSLTGNVATFVTTETMTSEWGRFPAEIVIKNNGDVIGTANFYLNGERNPHPEGTIDGDASTIIPQLTLLVERVETAASSVLDRQTVTQTLPAGSQASYSFDEETNTQTFGIPQGEAGAGAVDVTASAYSSSKTYAVGDYVIHNDYLYRCTTAITTAEAWTSGHWTQVLLGDEVSDVKSDIDDINDAIVVAYDTLAPYLYKKNTYIRNGVDTTLNGYDTFKIPLKAFDVLHFTWDAEFWTGLTVGYAVTVEHSDSTRTDVALTASYGRFVPTEGSEALILGAIANISDIVAVYITAKNDLISNVHIAVNKPYTQYSFDKNITVTLTEDNCIQSQYYFATSFLQPLASPYYMNWLKLNSGDKIRINKDVTGVTGKGKVISNDGSVSTFYDSVFTADSDCVVFVYNNSNISGDIMLVPANRTDIVDGNKSLKFIAGVIRNSGDGWEYINDVGHEPLNLTNISLDSSGRIIVDYGFTASKVLSLVATPDETFAGQYTIGGSVGLSSTVFNVYSLPKAYGGLVRIINNVVNVDNSSFTSGSFDTSTGEIRLYHPSLSALPAKEKFNISANAKEHRVLLGSQGNDYISLFLVDSSGAVVKSFTDTFITAVRQVNSVFVDANNIVDAGGNFWIYGVMEI